MKVEVTTMLTDEEVESVIVGDSVHWDRVTIDDLSWTAKVRDCILATKPIPFALILCEGRSPSGAGPDLFEKLEQDGEVEL